jgi:hypothetical protein
MREGFESQAPALVILSARKLETAELNWVRPIEKESVDGPDNQQHN